MQMKIIKIFSAFVAFLFLNGCTAESENPGGFAIVKTQRNESSEIYKIIKSFSEKNNFIADGYTLKGNNEIFSAIVKNNNGKKIATFVLVENLEYHFSFFGKDSKKTMDRFLIFFKEEANFNFAIL